MKIYVASFYDAKERIKPIVDRLRGFGHVVVSTWTEEPHTGDNDKTLTNGLRLYYAWRDLKEVDAADLLLLDTLDVNPRGGREFEAGYAYGTGKLVWLVGPERSIFHRYLQVRFETCHEVFRVLGQ